MEFLLIMSLLVHVVEVQHFDLGLGAKSENLSSVAPPGKRNFIDIMC